MGNCLSCFKVPPQASTASASDPASVMQPLQEICTRDSETKTWSGQQCQQPATTHLLHQHQQQQQQQQQQQMLEAKVLDTSQSNGNSNGSFLFTSVDTSSSSFYARIPSLTGASEKRGSRSSAAVILESNIVALFEQYKDNSEDSILDDGIERFCADLAVRPDDFCVLVLAWKFDASQMCCFTREEFVSGCKALRADSIRGIQSRLPDLCCQVQQDPELFKELYRFTFRFGLEVGQRILPSDMAICLWRLVFSQNNPPILDRWLNFLEKHSHVRGIPRDTWNMFLNFVESVGNDLSMYDDTEAWPSLFDDFVEFENDQMNQNISKNKDMM